jgi:hypothetical protein
VIKEWLKIDELSKDKIIISLLTILKHGGHPEWLTLLMKILRQNQIDYPEFRAIEKSINYSGTTFEKSYLEMVAFKETTEMVKYWNSLIDKELLIAKPYSYLSDDMRSSALELLSKYVIVMLNPPPPYGLSSSSLVQTSRTLIRSGFHRVVEHDKRQRYIKNKLRMTK